MVSSSADLALAYSSSLILPCWRSTSNWNSSSFIASSRMVERSPVTGASMRGPFDSCVLPVVRLGHDVEAAHHQHQRERAENDSAVLVQRIGSVDRSAQSAAGTIVIGRGLRSRPWRRRRHHRCRLSGTGSCTSAWKTPVPAMRKLRSCPGLTLVATMMVEPDLSGIVLERLRIFRREAHALGHHHDEVLHVAQRLGREAGLAAVGHVVRDLELRLAGAQRIG